MPGKPHAEINALNACKNSEGSTMYVTLEPCSHHGRTPPCIRALIDAKLKKIVISMVDPNPKVSGRGIRQLKKSGIEIEQGLLESQSRDITYTILGLPSFIEDGEIGETEIEEYHRANPMLFTSDEQVKIEYVDISVKELVNDIEANEESLKNFYNDN